ncbi:unnamed protein product [Bursaphelenchus xylophilus]|uniref:(pine wood nematode) hypothetical protein n=1 Tax=Bursaphelenchus xylophilus TaxID=6326 RepID=A0A1I7SW39_BURXY|nr:unnamed protein product [Bursaphelenchus xylophilus]CAG9098764.1 unnamed protein product [Bursaphelenchus xylophilus]
MFSVVPLGIIGETSRTQCREGRAMNDTPALSCIEVNCTYKTDAQRKLKQHVKRAHTGDVVICSVDGCGFSAKYWCLQKHVREFHGHGASGSEVNSVSVSDLASSVGCGSCSKSFSTQIQLKRHVARVHDKRYTEKPRDKQHKCNVDGCSKSFRTPGALDDHMNTHSDDRPFECQRCDKAFHGRASLAVHLRRYHLVSIKDFAKTIKFLRSESESNELRVMP